MAGERYGALGLGAGDASATETDREHAQRTAVYAQLIGQAMGLRASQLRALHKGALLHDVGKTVIPRDILNKPGPLTAEEWQVVRRHPSEGYCSLLGQVAAADVLDIVLFHHERFDGTGYPHGLKGENIPLLARVFSIADAFDAMISDRLYRRAMTPDAARREIVRCSGTQFDPLIVEVFCAIFIAVVHAPRQMTRDHQAMPAHIGFPAPLGVPVPAP